jgi:hypothetical protein
MESAQNTATAAGTSTRAASRVGGNFHSKLFCSQNTVQLMTASVVRVNNLAPPGSECNPRCGGSKLSGVAKLITTGGAAGQQQQLRAGMYMAPRRGGGGGSGGGGDGDGDFLGLSQRGESRRQQVTQQQQQQLEPVEPEARQFYSPVWSAGHNATATAAAKASAAATATAAAAAGATSAGASSAGFAVVGDATTATSDERIRTRTIEATAAAKPRSRSSASYSVPIIVGGRRGAA